MDRGDRSRSPRRWRFVSLADRARALLVAAEGAVAAATLAVAEAVAAAAEAEAHETMLDDRRRAWLVREYGGRAEDY